MVNDSNDIDSKSSTVGGLDLQQQFAFINFYHKLPEKTKTTIRFFNRVEYYCVHGEDALLISNLNFVHVLKTMGEGKRSLDTLIINKSNFQSIVRELLLVKHYRVEVYSNKTNMKLGTGWELEFWASPGNLTQFEDFLFSFEEKETESLIMAIKKCTDKPRTVGVAVIDTDTRQFYLGEISDDEYYSNTEAYLVQKSPKECLIPADHASEDSKLITILERNQIFVTTRKKNEFSDEDLEQDVSRLLKFENEEIRNVHAFAEMNLLTATHCLRALISYLQLMGNEGNFDQYSLLGIDYSKFVFMNSAVVSALNILPQKSNDKRPFGSVQYLLDHCRTAHGHRLLAQWLKQPLKDLNSIQERLAAVDIFVNNTEARMSLSDFMLKQIPDLQALGIKVVRKKAGLKDCYRIYEGIKKLPPLISTLEALTENSEVSNINSILSALISLLSDMEKYIEMMETTVDLALVETQQEFMINPSFDDDLQDMRQTMDELQRQMNSYLEKQARKLDLVADKSIKLEMTPYGYCYRVTLMQEKLILNDSKYNVLDTVRGGVRFQDDKLKEADEQYQQCKKNYEEHQKTIVEEVVKIAAGYAATLNYLSSVLAELDVLVSFAVASAGATIPYVRPVIRKMGSGVLILEQCRHPCVEAQDHISYIPNDLYLKKDECTCLAITGPNMGGKSTYIRSAAISVLLAHIGCFVPCERAEISIVDQIFSRLGAGDAQHKGLSTFMVEMVEASIILKRATENSLVIIDELGRGTSTYDGCGIAWSIAEHLSKEVKAFSLFATHFHEITFLSKYVPTFRNFHVSAVEDKDSLVLLYQLKEGPCLKSYGLHCAKVCGFPDEVLKDAREKMKYYVDYQFELQDDDKKDAIVEEGENLMDEFLAECKSLNLAGLSDEELLSQINNLKRNLISKNNTYVNSFLTSL